tara:strand:+ start:2059 stop:2478 length:420 start_codon:yes stop_codon:yes gene_type:complete
LIKKISDKDFKDWLDFINSNEKLDNKDTTNKKVKSTLKEKSIDLHGYSLDQANKIIHDFILLCYEKNIGKIKVITGKGDRSKNKDNPYKSEKLSLLKYSVPEYINSKPDLLKVIKFINEEDISNFSKGSFDIFLKNFRE